MQRGWAVDFVEVGDADTLQTNVSNGKSVKLTKDIKLDAPLMISAAIWSACCADLPM